MHFGAQTGFVFCRGRRKLQHKGGHTKLVGGYRKFGGGLWGGGGYRAAGGIASDRGAYRAKVGVDACK